MLIFISISLIYFNYLGDCFESGNIILEDKHLDTLRYILSNEIDEYVFFHSFTSFIHSFAHSHSLLYIYIDIVCVWATARASIDCSLILVSVGVALVFLCRLPNGIQRHRTFILYYLSRS